MSGGKKKSGFQITSVTSDYGQASAESPKSSLPGESGTPPFQALTNGGQSAAPTPSLTAWQAGRPPTGSPGESGDLTAPSSAPSVSVAAAGEGGGKMPNGPALLNRARTLHQHASSSQPGTPVSARKQLSQEQGGAGSPHSSRFRVVRLGQGLGEPYRRGRWTCVDFLEREGGEERGLRRVKDSMRHAHSLESLETVGLGGAEGGGGGPR
ncbi:hypothetical protein MATL_G00167200 [Megalops atlanticus]|uniref:TSC22 domain family member 4 n=1 Tax=Megalops atlanticus TaxID=7932 RepID=A0A9D3PQI2_MEGAT|nr:hypothetical protein MATL_G00167200 [Megalops atlanticus]